MTQNFCAARATVSPGGWWAWPAACWPPLWWRASKAPWHRTWRATSIGLFLPWLLGQLGRDPAYGSGPLATIAQDLLTLLIYFGTVQAIAI